MIPMPIPTPPTSVPTSTTYIISVLSPHCNCNLVCLSACLLSVGRPIDSWAVWHFDRKIFHFCLPAYSNEYTHSRKGQENFNHACRILTFFPFITIFSNLSLYSSLLLLTTPLTVLPYPPSVTAPTIYLPFEIGLTWLTLSEIWNPRRFHLN